jgi:hypothetical protein
LRDRSGEPRPSGALNRQFPEVTQSSCGRVAARVEALAAPGEVLVSDALPTLAAGSGIVFEDRGDHELKGVSGTRRLYSVLSSAASALQRRAVGTVTRTYLRELQLPDVQGLAHIELTVRDPEVSAAWCERALSR